MQQPLITTLRVSEASELSTAVRELAGIGPVSRLLTDQPQNVLDLVFPAMETALQAYFQPGALNMTAAAWMVTAVKP